jgi:hypothetical protein
MRGDKSRRDRLDEWLIWAAVTIPSKLAGLLRPGSVVILVAATEQRRQPRRSCP